MGGRGLFLFYYFFRLPRVGNHYPDYYWILYRHPSGFSYRQEDSLSLTVFSRYICQEVTMKRMNVLRIIGIALILSLLSAVLPVLPAFAAESIIVTPTQAQVGASVSFSGSG